MTTKQGIDAAWARFTVAQIKAVGAHFVMRYLSNDPSKNLTAAEVKDYHAAGLETGVVWETTAGRALAGHAAGVSDAKTADGQRKAVGLPSDMVIHFAVDTDTTWSAVQPYFDGVTSVIGKSRTGAYGGVKIVDGAYAYGLRHLWQTIAWSGGVQSRHATLYQHGGTTLGGKADWDTALAADYGQYPRPTAAPAPTPTPAPKPAPKPTVDLSKLVQAAKADPKAKQGHVTYSGTKTVENALVAEGLLSKALADGSYGTATVTAYAKWQRRCGYNGTAADGIPGKTSLSKLAAKHGFTVVA